MRNPVSHFSFASSDINISRSRLKRSSKHLTTFDAGFLIPIYRAEYVPGDTITLNTNSLVRMSTPIFPVADQAFMDIFYFSVPYRLVWDHWKEFMGESPSDPYLNPITYSVPQLTTEKADNKNVAFHSLLDFFGIPAGTAIDSISSLPLRAYALIWNEWFRDQNLQNAIDIPHGDADYGYVTDDDILTPDDDPEYYVTQVCRGGYPAPVNKYHDYFTSALLEPQKGAPVAIPLNGFAPVYALGSDGTYQASVNNGDQVMIAGEFSGGDGRQIFADNTGNMFTGSTYQVSGTPSPQQLKFSNLYANLGATTLSGMDVYATINDLRYAFQIQQLLQNDALYGTRYYEIIKGHFQVDPSNVELARPEFLFGKKIQLNMQQVVQTSSTTEVSPQGNVAAYSLTVDGGNSFTKSFTEHGIIIGVACVRTLHSYQQGVERFWSRKDRYDFYFPELAMLPSQPIYNREIYNGPQGVSDLMGGYSPYTANEIFGYQEAWADYRYEPNRVSSYFRSTYPESLDAWHYADYYTEQPRLSSEWIRETPNNIERTLAVQSNIQDQIIADFWFDATWVRPMPPYSYAQSLTRF